MVAVTQLFYAISFGLVDAKSPFKRRKNNIFTLTISLSLSCAIVTLYNPHTQIARLQFV